MGEFLSFRESGIYGSLKKGHPVKAYLDENALMRELILKISKNINNLDDPNQIGNENDSETNNETFLELFYKLSKFEKHFARKENQLFPYLEKYGWTSPSQNMWAFHDAIREEFKAARKSVEAKEFAQAKKALIKVFASLEHIMTVEEQRLFPNALNMLSDEDWEEMAQGDCEIGWMFEEEYVHPSKDTKKRNLPFSLEGRVKLEEGYMLPEQINLLLKFMPVDITYVDENDVVIFYNRGEERVFPRSAGIIGREVRFCHPPKSVDMVLEILKEFKAGRKDEAEFWIEFKGKFIHIRYFAIRDSDGIYKGVIEVSQDVTHIRGLKGEKRLLDDWK